MKGRFVARLTVAAIAVVSSSLLPARASGIKPGDPGVYQFGSSLYKLVSGPSWAQAEANAVQLGGHLAAIGSEEENSFLFSAFNLSGDWDNLNYQPLWGDSQMLPKKGLGPGPMESHSSIRTGHRLFLSMAKAVLHQMEEHPANRLMKTIFN